MPPLDKIPGLEIEKDSATSPEVLFGVNAKKETADMLVSQLKDGSTLWFYDSQRDAISDPGVFVTVARVDDHLLAKFSNHGWSTAWAEVPRDMLVDYLWECRNDNRIGVDRFYRSAGMRLHLDANPEIRIDSEATDTILEHIRSRIEHSE